MAERARSGFGKCLAELRQARGVSQKVLSLSAGMDPSYLSGVEVGRRPPPRDRQLVRLATALNATEAEIAQLKIARALTQISRAACEFRGESEPVLARLLTTATGMSSAEIAALETVAQVLKSRHGATGLGGNAM